MNISKHTDILVMGSGLSGAIASISAADEGETDSPEKLKQDIIKAGAYIIYWKTQNN